jgi:dUTP pyrophosphatase
MRNNEFFSVFVRSGHGFKHSLRLANSTGIIDADFLKEIMIKIRNPYNKIITIPAGDAMAQGIFMQYLTSDDDGATAGGDRVGGFGSTDKK